MKNESSGSDDQLSREIDDALAGIDLQAIGDAETTPAAPAAKAGAKPAKNKDLWRGTVVGTSGDDIIIELGPRMQGVIKRTSFDEPPKEGAQFDFALKGQEDGLWLLSLDEAKAIAAWNQIEVGARVKARVTGQNKGGLELKVGPVSAFMPASHAALGRVDELETLIGQSFECEVLEYDRERKRVLISRRVVLEAERETAREESLGSISVGQVVKGKVTRIESFGAFVDIGGGLEGMVHVSNLSRRRVEDPNELVKKGQELSVMVLTIQEGGKRIALGAKQLEDDPWDGAAMRYPVGQIVSGRVVRLTDFGAFVEIEPGLDGLLHISQMGRDRVRRPQDATKVGEELSVRIVSVEPARQRIGLSRLDERGSVIGSDEAVDGSAIQEMLDSTQRDDAARTNLGALFKKALEE